MKLQRTEQQTEMSRRSNWLLRYGLFYTCLYPKLASYMQRSNQQHGKSCLLSPLQENITNSWQKRYYLKHLYFSILWITLEIFIIFQLLWRSYNGSCVHFCFAWNCRARLVCMKVYYYCNYNARYLGHQRLFLLMVCYETMGLI